MDPITAVSLAGTILQIIELGAKVAIRVADFSSAVDGVPKPSSRSAQSYP